MILRLTTLAFVVFLLVFLVHLNRAGRMFRLNYTRTAHSNLLRSMTCLVIQLFSDRLNLQTFTLARNFSDFSTRNTCKMIYRDK